MSGVIPLCVPLVVDVKTGMNWAQTEPWSDAGEKPIDFGEEMSNGS